MVLSKEKTLFPRDEKGELVPQEVSLIVDEDNERQKKYKGETIIIVPLVRGELSKVFAKEKEDENFDIDADIILKHCIKPKYSAEEIPFIKDIAPAIVNTILFESGLDIGKKVSVSQKEKETEFSKN